MRQVKTEIPEIREPTEAELAEQYKNEYLDHLRFIEQVFNYEVYEQNSNVQNILGSLLSIAASPLYQVDAIKEQVDKLTQECLGKFKFEVEEEE
jgi:hypothetical protein